MSTDRRQNPRRLFRSDPPLAPILLELLWFGFFVT